MPDAYGNFKGISVPAAAWVRIFGAGAEYVCPECGAPASADGYRSCLHVDEEDVGVIQADEYVNVNRDKPINKG